MSHEYCLTSVELLLYVDPVPDDLRLNHIERRDVRWLESLSFDREHFFMIGFLCDQEAYIRQVLPARIHLKGNKCLGHLYQFRLLILRSPALKIVMICKQFITW